MRSVGYIFVFPKGVTIAQCWLHLLIYKRRHHRQLFDIILPLLRVSLSRIYGYNFWFIEGVAIAILQYYLGFILKASPNFASVHLYTIPSFRKTKLPAFFTSVHFFTYSSIWRTTRPPFCTQRQFAPIVHHFERHNSRMFYLRSLFTISSFWNTTSPAIFLTNAHLFKCSSVWTTKRLSYKCPFVQMFILKHQNARPANGILPYHVLCPGGLIQHLIISLIYTYIRSPYIYIYTSVHIDSKSKNRNQLKVGKWYKERPPLFLPVSIWFKISSVRNTKRSPFFYQCPFHSNSHHLETQNARHFFYRCTFCSYSHHYATQKRPPNFYQCAFHSKSHHSETQHARQFATSVQFYSKSIRDARLIPFDSSGHHLWNKTPANCLPAVTFYSKSHHFGLVPVPWRDDQIDTLS